MSGESATPPHQKSKFSNFVVDSGSSSDGDSIFESMKSIGRQLLEDTQTKSRLKKVSFTLHSSSSSESVDNDSANKFSSRKVFEERRRSTPTCRPRFKYRHSASDSGFPIGNDFKTKFATTRDFDSFGNDGSDFKTKFRKDGGGDFAKFGKDSGTDFKTNFGKDGGTDFNTKFGKDGGTDFKTKFGKDFKSKDGGSDFKDSRFVKFRESRIRLQSEMDRFMTDDKEGSSFEYVSRKAKEAFSDPVEDSLGDFPLSFRMSGRKGMSGRERAGLFATQRSEPQLRSWSLDRNAL